MLSEQFDARLESFTGREQDVMQGMAQFQTNDEIAEDLSISVKTVRWYIKQIYSKLGVNNRVKAIEVIQHLLDDEIPASSSPEKPGKAMPKPPKLIASSQSYPSLVLLLVMLLIITVASTQMQLPVANSASILPVREDDAEPIILETCYENDRTSALCLIPLDGGIPQEINLDPKYYGWGGASWNPDGTQIVFSALNSEHNLRKLKLYIADRDGSNIRAVLPDYSTENQLSPGWSPDGQWIAFHHAGLIDIIHPDGTDLQTIWHMQGEMNCASHPVWSADSQYLMFSVGRCHWTAPIEREIILYSLSDSSFISMVTMNHQIEECGVVLENLAFSPDGTQIVYTEENCNHILQDIESGEIWGLMDFPTGWTNAVYPQWQTSLER